MEDLWRLPGVELAGLIRSKKVSAKEAASAALARLDAVNPKINAVIDHRPEQVLAQAALIDASIARGEDAGPLAGVPVTVKANIDQEGFATTNGLKLQRDVIAASNSPVVDNLRKAGAVILGRTNCPAFSYRWFTTNLIHGDTKNPRDPGITPGGSSGGAGAAVACRHRPYRARHRYRRLHSLPGLCLRRSWPAADRRPYRGLQCVAARTRHRAADFGGIRPARAHHRRSQGRARRDVRSRCARSLVGAGAARRARNAEARRVVPSARRT